MSDAYNHLKSHDGSIDVKFQWAPKSSKTIETNATTLAFDGRELPLAYFGEGRSEVEDVSFTNDISRDGGDMWTELQAGLALRETLQWIDVFDNDVTVLVTGSRWEPIVSGDKTLRQISFRMTRVEDVASDSGS